MKDELLLQQWRLCVEMADKMSQRRSLTNSLFITINIGMISVYFSLSHWSQVAVSIFVVIINCVWWQNIKSYKLLNGAKFKVILEMEKELPCQAFGNEWNFLQADDEYKNLTDVEKWLPLIFGVSFALYGFFVFNCGLSYSSNVLL